MIVSGSKKFVGEKEIEFHAERSSFRRIVRHHGPTKYSGRGAEEEMERADIM